MKIVKSLIGVIIFIAVFCCIAGKSLATQESLLPLTCKIEPLEYDVNSGQLSVEVKFSRTKSNWPSCKCDMV
ncbi:MAG: hypothetical protein ABIJ12_11420, partial [bacterium]